MVNGDSKVGIRFDLSNADVIDFVRNYDFAWARRQIVFDVETFRGLLIKAETEGWSLPDLTREIQAVTPLDAALADQTSQIGGDDGSLFRPGVREQDSETRRLPEMRAITTASVLIWTALEVPIASGA